MGHALQVRGSFQVVDLRTLNAEISELLKEDLDDIDKRSTFELTIAGGTVDQLIDFSASGITNAKAVLIRSDQLIDVKFNSAGSTAIKICFMINIGEITSLYVSTSADSTIKIIALDT